MWFSREQSNGPCEAALELWLLTESVQTLMETIESKVHNEQQKRIYVTAIRQVNNVFTQSIHCLTDFREVLNNLNVECDIGCDNETLIHRSKFQITQATMLLNDMPANFSQWLAHHIIGGDGNGLSKLNCGAIACMPESLDTLSEVTDKLISSLSGKKQPICLRHF